MKYNIKAHPTMYCCVLFRSRLEARWAAFFDLAGWEWEYEPVDVVGWSPDFRVRFPCGHSECGGSHTLLCEVKPYFTIEEFDGHQCMKYPYGGTCDRPVRTIPADASAALGANPGVSYWEMTHGAGGGVECVEHWVSDWRNLWAEAGNRTQYKPQS